MSPTSLSVVVPVYNIEGQVDRLERELRKVDTPDIQIVVVDDGSDDGTAEALASLADSFSNLDLIRSPANAGAGAARNRGFATATGTYAHFFDADDVLHPEALAETRRILEDTGADTSVNRYDFIRDGHRVATGMNAFDQHFWNSRPRPRDGQPFRLAAAEKLLTFTNFPWNKLVRTARYRMPETTPLFGETRVNNDILGHWNILLHAREIVLVDREIVTHRMSGAHDHLSRKFGPERLELFAALGELHDRLDRTPETLRQFGHVYWDFVRRMTTWAGGRLDQAVRADFDAAQRDLLARVTLSELSTLKQFGDDETYRWLMRAIA